MQVPQVTEQVALAVIELYPTVLSLAQAYSMLVSPLILLSFTLSYKYQLVHLVPLGFPVLLSYRVSQNGLISV
jgi:hypothetical protein